VGLTQTEHGARPSGGGRGSRLQGSGDGGVTSHLYEEKVVARRQRRGARSEGGLCSSDAGKSRTGHGRRREGQWQRWQRWHGLRSEGLAERWG
jgi:hypothetical protein